MASKKMQKTDLVAICRLEFYRKQKNWKFCSGERKPKDSKKKTKTANCKLNQTYNIELKKEDPQEPVDKEEQPNLDEAFVETETGTELHEQAQLEELLIDLKKDLNTKTENILPPLLDPLDSPYSPKWSIQRWVETTRQRSLEPPAPNQDSNCPQLETYYTEDAHYPAIDPVYNNQHTYYQLKHPQNANYPSTCPHENFSCPPPLYETASTKVASVLYYNSNMYHGSDVLRRERIIDHGYNVAPELLIDHGPDVARRERILDHGCNVPPECLIDHGTDVPYREPDMPCSGAMPYREPNVPYLEFNVSPVGETCALVAGKFSAPGDWQCAGEGRYGEDGGWRDWAEGAEAIDLVDGARCRPLQPRDWLGDDASMESLPSVTSDEFMRGAALAPHSTQADLLGAESPPAVLSGAALARAVTRHSRALRQLLAEARRRQTQVGESSCSDEVPVRDPGPAPGPDPDRIVAGSEPLAGRGRGRLIGIGMGRPYRL